MSNGFMNCPYCGRLIADNSTTCQHCGKAIEQVQPQVIPADGNNSGQGENSVVPDIVANRFSWGAFCFNWIWCIVYKKYILALVEFLCGFIPILGSIIVLGLNIWFGINGNKWAWQAKRYKSIEEFHEIHKKWATIGLIIWLLLFVGGIIAALTIPTLIKSTNNQQLVVSVKKEIAIMSQVSQLQQAKGTRLFDLSSESIAAYFAEEMHGNIEGNVITGAVGETYTFHSNGSCSDESCYVLVDSNGEKAPNEEWIILNQPKDIIRIPLRGDSNGINVYRPAVFSKKNQ